MNTSGVLKVTVVKDLFSPAVVYQSDCLTYLKGAECLDQINLLFLKITDFLKF